MNAKGKRLIWVEAAVVDRLTPMRNGSESYGEVYLLAAERRRRKDGEGETDFSVPLPTASGSARPGTLQAAPCGSCPAAPTLAVVLQAPPKSRQCGAAPSTR